MANRAYLFFTDDPADDPQLVGEPEPVYLDSRHQIPVAWWFLFASGDAFLKDGISDSGGSVGWQEVRFQTPLSDAIARIKRRRKLLDAIVGHRLDLRCIDFLIATLSVRQAKLLFMNPNEVVYGDFESDCAAFNELLARIDAVDAAPAEVSQLLSQFSQVEPSAYVADTPGTAIVQIIGCTYDSLSALLWDQIMAEGIPLEHIDYECAIRQAGVSQFMGGGFVRRNGY